MKNINWYPGHMKKTRELIAANLKMVDLVIEVVDLRIPISSRNPIIDELIKDKPRIIALNKCDLSDARANELWQNHYKSMGYGTVLLNSNSGAGVKALLSALSKEEKIKNKDQARHKALRIMIVGVPNVGKSSLINRLTGRKSTQTGDRPGVTKGKQWLSLSNGMQLLDTPGILWPKFEDPKVGVNLAFCGSIKDEIMDLNTLAFELIKLLGNNYPKLLQERYKLDKISEDALENMDAIALKRGFILPGKRIDYDRCAKIVIDEFRSGKIGNITLEYPEVDND
ncbi:ribosome biogenesis GTPase A [Peptostreptococcaceae bacterium pGA-8]|nr:ribosome biogenesis GTPase A [Peptostreptococcaceae bacterium pGA-8]